MEWNEMEWNEEMKMKLKIGIDIETLKIQNEMKWNGRLELI